MPAPDFTFQTTGDWVNAWFGSLEQICPISTSLESGIASWRCTVPQGSQDRAAWRVALGIAARRLALAPELFACWLGAASGAVAHQVTPAEASLMEAYGLLVDVGTAAQPASDDEFYGMLAEAVLHELLSTADYGLGGLELLEGHDWSSLDKGGDKLAIYSLPGSRAFRLWESKARRSTTSTAGDVVRGAAVQLELSATSYIGRFAVTASRSVKDQELAAFIASLPRLWVDRDASAGVGVSVTTHVVPTTQHPFAQLRTRFDLPDTNKAGQLILLGDLATFRQTVADTIWNGMS